MHGVHPRRLAGDPLVRVDHLLEGRRIELRVPARELVECRRVRASAHLRECDQTRVDVLHVLVEAGSREDVNRASIPRAAVPFRLRRERDQRERDRRLHRVLQIEIHLEWSMRHVQSQVENLLGLLHRRGHAVVEGRKFGDVQLHRRTVHRFRSSGIDDDAFDRRVLLLDPLEHAPNGVLELLHGGWQESHLDGRLARDRVRRGTTGEGDQSRLSGGGTGEHARGDDECVSAALVNINSRVPAEQRVQVELDPDQTGASERGAVDREGQLLLEPAGTADADRRGLFTVDVDHHLRLQKFLADILRSSHGGLLVHGEHRLQRSMHEVLVRLGQLEECHRGGNADAVICTESGSIGAHDVALDDRRDWILREIVDLVVGFGADDIDVRLQDDFRRLLVAFRRRLAEANVPGGITSAVQLVRRAEVQQLLGDQSELGGGTFSVRRTRSLLREGEGDQAIIVSSEIALQRGRSLAL